MAKLAVTEVREKLAREQKALKEKYAERLAVAKKRDQRVINLEAKKLRAKENHAKYLLAGFLIAEMKESKNISILKKCLATLTKERDIEDMKALIETVTNSVPVSPKTE